MTTNEVKRLNTADTVINRNLDIKQDCRQIIDTLVNLSTRFTGNGRMASAGAFQLLFGYDEKMQNVG